MVQRYPLALPQSPPRRSWATSEGPAISATRSYTMMSAGAPSRMSPRSLVPGSHGRQVAQLAMYEQIDLGCPNLLRTPAEGTPHPPWRWNTRAPLPPAIFTRSPYVHSARFSSRTSALWGQVDSLWG